MYERDPVTPIEVLFDIPSAGIDDSFVQPLAEHVAKIGDIAKQKLTNSQDKNKLNYDQKRRAVEYSVGDKVIVYFLLRRVGKSQKLLHKWLGPFKITKKFSPLVYEIDSI